MEQYEIEDSVYLVRVENGRWSISYTKFNQVGITRLSRVMLDNLFIFVSEPSQSVRAQGADLLWAHSTFNSSSEAESFWYTHRQFVLMDVDLRVKIKLTRNGVRRFDYC
jgi:hypothetical protein